ncbi:MAG: hypothetical protein ACLUAR_04610 [Pilosibacter sp.]
MKRVKNLNLYQKLLLTIMPAMASGICNPIFYHNFKSRILLQEYDIETDSGK